MALNIVTEQIKETRFLSQVSRSIYQIWMGSHLQKLKHGRKMPKMQIDTYSKMFFFLTCMSAILDFYDLDQF